jgi:uncharacterized membrane protein YqjE
MENSTASIHQLATASKQFVRRLGTIGENRLELLAVELQEERGRILHAVLLALGMTAFGTLAGITLTAALAYLLWTWSPLGLFAILTVLYAAAAGLLYRRLNGLQRDWRSFSASLDQLRKDRACLEKLLP